MRVGLVGFASSGKSTVFAALTGVDPSAGKGGIGTIRVPDARVDRLAELCRPRKTTYAEIVFQDYPTGSFGSSSVSSAMLGELRNLEVLAEVIDAFAARGRDEIEQAAAAFHGELLLADLAVIEKRLDRLSRERGEAGEKELLERCRAALEDDRELRELELDPHALAQLSGYKFLTLKPRLIVANVAEEGAGAVDAPDAELGRWGLSVVTLCASLELELSRLEPAERAEFLAGLGLRAAASERFVTSCYRMLDLITFLTAGEDEVRAWPIRRGASALEAAGKIHSDIARGFIRAEIIAYEDYIRYEGESGCRSAGKLRVEGKSYVVSDGDVAHFRFNV